MRPTFAFILLLVSTFMGMAQASYDLRIIETADDNTNSGTLQVSLQIRANASSSPASFEMGTSTILLDYNTSAITYSSVTPSNFSGFTAPSTFYSPMTATDNSGKLSINIVLSSGAGTGQPNITTAWTDVCLLNFTINDATAAEKFFIYDSSTPGSKTEVFDDDLSTQLTPEVLIGFTNTDNGEIYWDGDGWSNGSGSSNAPGSGDGGKDCFVLGKDAVLSEHATVNDFSIENGTFSIRPTGTIENPSLTINGTGVTNGNVLTLESNSNGYGQLVGAVTGEVIVQMYVDQAGWHNLGSPITSSILDDLEDDINIHYQADSANGGISAYYWDASTGDFIGATDSSDTFNRGWNIYIDDNFVPAGGGVNSDGALPVVLDITGTLATGNQNSSINYYSGAGSWGAYAAGNGDDGWNLIYNPYPSNIDWTQIAPDIAGSISDYFYVWDPSMNSGAGGYIYSNASTGTTPTFTIAPMQAFWVKLGASGDAASAAFNFVDGDRTISNPARQYKTSAELRLSLTRDSDGFTDQTIIVRETGKSINFEFQGDAKKFKHPSPDASNFYVITPDSATLAVSAIDASFLGDTVFLGVFSSKAESHTIAVDKNSFPLDYKVELFDRKTGTTTDLLATDYAFMHDPAFDEHRFDLIAVSKYISVEEEDSTPEAFTVRNENGGIVLSFGEVLSSQVDIDIIDMAGRVLYRKESVSTFSPYSCSFTSSSRETAVYVVRLRDTQTDEVYAQKFIY